MLVQHHSNLSPLILFSRSMRILSRAGCGGKRKADKQKVKRVHTHASSPAVSIGTESDLLALGKCSQVHAYSQHPRQAGRHGTIAGLPGHASRTRWGATSRKQPLDGEGCHSLPLQQIVLLGSAMWREGWIGGHIQQHRHECLHRARGEQRSEDGAHSWHHHLPFRSPPPPRE